MIDKIAEIFDKLKITRRFGYFFTLWITWIAVDYSFTLVMTAMEKGVDMIHIAAIVAAILVPVSGLQGAVINFYHNGGKRE